LSNNNIKYPIAFHKISEKLIDISEVTDDHKSELICIECEESFIAIRKHQTPHFKHKPGSNCKGNVESYIHRLAKEVFKNIKEIELPEIFKDDLPYNQKEKLYNQVNNLIRTNVPENLQVKFRKDLKKNISESGIFQIEKTEIEKEYESSLGNVEIDIVITIKNQELFIEPFFTNQIDNFKKRKLALINTPTLSIDLLSFVQKYNYNYNLEKLKRYLISKNSKKWIFNREKKIEKYTTEYLNYLSEEIKQQENNFKINRKKLNRINELIIERNRLYLEINSIDHEIKEISDDIGTDDDDF
jgi:hypothetical protein